LFETKNAPMPFYCHTKDSTFVSLQIFYSICSRNLNTETATFPDELLKEQISL